MQGLNQIVFTEQYRAFMGTKKKKKKNNLIYFKSTIAKNEIKNKNKDLYNNKR
jgi:hypothetical protein